MYLASYHLGLRTRPGQPVQPAGLGASHSRGEGEKVPKPETPAPTPAELRIRREIGNPERVFLK